MGDGASIKDALAESGVTSMEMLLSMDYDFIREVYFVSTENNGRKVNTPINRGYANRIAMFISWIHKLRRESPGKVLTEEDWATVTRDSFDIYVTDRENITPVVELEPPDSPIRFKVVLSIKNVRN
jgi:hypothetical protein